MRIFKAIFIRFLLYFSILSNKFRSFTCIFFVDTPVLALTGKWSKKNNPGYLKSVDEKRYIIVFLLSYCILFALHYE